MIVRVKLLPVTMITEAFAGRNLEPSNVRSLLAEPGKMCSSWTGWFWMISLLVCVTCYKDSLDIAVVCLLMPNSNRSPLSLAPCSLVRAWFSVRDLRRDPAQCSVCFEEDLKPLCICVTSYHNMILENPDCFRLGV